MCSSVTSDEDDSKCTEAIETVRSSPCTSVETPAPTRISKIDKQTLIKDTEDAKSILRRGTWYAAASLWLLLVASSLTMPHQQGRRDMLHCDNLCLGTLTS